MNKLLPLLALLLVGQTHAHGLWTEQRRGNIEAVYGHGAEDNAFQAEKISGAWAYDTTGRMIPVTVQRLEDHARFQPLKPAAVLAVALDNGPWSKNAEGRWINQGRRQVPDSSDSLHTFKYSLAIYQENASLPALDQLKMVIRPLTDPLRAGPGQPLAVQVLVDGKPAAGIELIGDYRGAPHAVSATTDADGRAQVVVRNQGLNIIAAHTYIPVENDPDIERRGLFSSLTFLGEAHRE
jgi:uncharacterized GH25 family protein